MKNITLTPEEQLVLAAMKLKPTAEELARMERLVAEVQDWNYCTRLAIDRGIGPLLNHKIPMLGNSHLIPADAQARLQQSYLRTLARSMRLYEAFREVGTALNEAGIKFVALKGVYLAEALYEDIGLRLFSDIDLLVAEEDGERSLEVLREVGYESRGIELFHSEFVKKHSDRVHYLPMIKGDVSVEIHIKLHYYRECAAFDIKRMIHESDPVKITNIAAYTLSLYDLLIHICAHIHKHFENGHVQFSGYTDVINLITHNQQNFNWYDFQSRCNYHQCWGIVSKQIKLVYHFYCLLIPEDIIRNLHFDTIKKDEAMFVFYLRGSEFTPSNVISFRRSLNRFDRFGDKLRYLWDIIFPSKEFMINKYQTEKKFNLRRSYIRRLSQLIWRAIKKKQ